MLAIEVTFLTGRFVATNPSDRNAAEWPPAPARLFSAMVAAWASEEARDTDEADALRWLEQQPAPAIAASMASERRVVTHYVPVNDVAVVRSHGDKALQIEELLRAAGPKAAMKVAKLREVSRLVTPVGATSTQSAVELLPEQRPRQPRTYPSVTPIDPVVTYIWDVDLPEGIATALDRLLGRVHRVGHSSSMVSARLTGRPGTATWMPAADGETRLRWVRAGQFDALERLYLEHQASRPRSLPSSAVRYRPVCGLDHSPAVSADVPARWTVLEVGTSQRRPSILQVAALTQAFRNALLANLPPDAPESATGHAPDGTPSRSPHAGFLALPWVGEHGAGTVLGLALAAPDRSTEDVLLDAMARWFAASAGRPEVVAGRAGRWGVRSASQATALTLRPERWAATATTWVTAVPLALPRHPGDLRASDPTMRARAWDRAEAGVIECCRHIGLPDPVQVTVDRQPMVVGARPASQYPALRQTGRDGRPVARVLVHAQVKFAAPVRGPVILGAGRFLGLGLMVPLYDNWEGEHG